MTKISYPDDWMGQESTGLIVNYAELTKLAKANGLNSGHLSYLVGSVVDTTLGTINRMIADVPPTDSGVDK